jgi:streptogramin lyase
VRRDRFANPAERDGEPSNPGSALITEYAIPEPQDLPHDLAVLRDGRVLITGMFTHRMYLLEPGTGEYGFEPIPVANANPRAVEVDQAGDWWVLLGGPRQVARREAVTGAWKFWPIGMYPHSIGLDEAGRVWFNGHFTRQPELIGHVRPADGRVTLDTVPEHPRAASGFGPIPYELRVGPGGLVWVSELAGNRVVSYDPAGDRYRVFEMPGPFSGPRRLDIGAGGEVWIPEYSGNRLARLDAATGGFEEFELPVRDALPYVVRVDAARTRVWIGTGAADMVFLFDPSTRRFTTYPLPTRGAMVRHLDIDPRNGDVWAAYGASPGVPSKVARLRLRS